jgi:hypothetical protein
VVGHSSDRTRRQAAEAERYSEGADRYSATMVQVYSAEGPLRWVLSTIWAGEREMPDCAVPAGWPGRKVSKTLLAEIPQKMVQWTAFSATEIQQRLPATRPTL